MHKTKEKKGREALGNKGYMVSTCLCQLLMEAPCYGVCDVKKKLLNSMRLDKRHKAMLLTSTIEINHGDGGFEIFFHHNFEL